MDKNYEISKEFEGIHFKIQPNGKDEVVSRSSINVINHYREGFIVKKNNVLLAICHESKELDIEFVKQIDRPEFDSFNSLLPLYSIIARIAGLAAEQEMVLSESLELAQI